jgi:hypothetical protein
MSVKDDLMGDLHTGRVKKKGNKKHERRNGRRRRRGRERIKKEESGRRLQSYLCNDADASRYDGCFGLCATHAPEPRGDKHFAR